MRREAFIHFAIWFSFFVFVSIFNGYLSLSYWPFWVGGVIGTILPDIDNLIYIFFLNPQELTSQRVNYNLQKMKIGRMLTLLHETRSERKGLVFHTFIFKLIIFALAFLIITSSTSILGKGIVLAFCIHLVIDELMDFDELKNLDNWGNIFSKESTSRSIVLYIFLSFLVVCIMGVMM